jgi:hypothetical protein
LTFGAKQGTAAPLEQSDLLSRSDLEGLRKTLALLLSREELDSLLSGLNMLKARVTALEGVANATTPSSAATTGKSKEKMSAGKENWLSKNALWNSKKKFVASGKREAQSAGKDAMDIIMDNANYDIDRLERDRVDLVYDESIIRQFMADAADEADEQGVSAVETRQAAYDHFVRQIEQGPLSQREARMGMLDDMLREGTAEDPVGVRSEGAFQLLSSLGIPAMYAQQVRDPRGDVDEPIAQPDPT